MTINTKQLYTKNAYIDQTVEFQQLDFSVH